MSLCEWYAKREVLLTGVTSELGRALLEKILRCLPDVRVYVVLRFQNGLNGEERLKKIFTSPGYERLRQEMPGAMSRVKTFEGNLLYEDLALSIEDKASLREVTVAFHAAGPHDSFLEYCQELPKLRSIAAASSIFRHRGRIAECLQNEKIPNLPVALVRFPCIGPAYKEPMPGFVESLKGPTALMVGAGFACGNSELPAEIIPIDIAVNTMIAAAWEVGITNATKPVVYNASQLGCTWDDLIKKSRRASSKFPYPTFGIRGMTSIEPLYWILVIFLEWLPSLIYDIVFGLCGRKQSNFLLVLKMSIFVPNKVYLRGILLHYFIQKKSAAEVHRILVQTYDDNALSDTTCRDWFRRFKNNDFQLEDKERSGAPKKFQDKELEQLLDEDPSQTLSELGKILHVDESTVSKRLKGLGLIQKQGHWVPYELKPRDVLLQRQKRKGFLPTGDRYRLQLMRLSRALKEKRPLYAQRHDKMILLHDNARPHVAKPVKTYLETLKWEVLPHPPYSPGIAPSDFHLFRSMAHGLADRRFHSYEEAQKWIDSWIASKDMSFFRRGIHVLPDRWEKVVSSDGQYFK
ncbi:MOS1T transposase, partial [Pseudoatta argentina]